MRVCAEEQNVIALIRRLAAVNLDAAAIARQLNSMGVPCRSRLWRAQAVAKCWAGGEEQRRRMLLASTNGFSRSPAVTFETCGTRGQVLPHA
jgi:hypothetical protein